MPDQEQPKKDPEIEFRYFSPVEGHAVARFGTGSTIGASRSPSGFVINPDAVVPIPKDEVARYAKEYADAIRHGELLEKKQADYDAFKAKQAERSAPKTKPQDTPAEDESSERIATPDDVAEIEADKAGGTEK